MKRIFIIALLAGGISAFGQKKKDDIVYYEDAQVKHSRFGFALNLLPNYTNRRLINDEIPDNGDFMLPNSKATGALQLNYGADIFYSVGSALDISIGFGHESADYKVENVRVYDGGRAVDSLGYIANMATSAKMYTIPVKLNFNTSVTDIWDLEVVPTVQFNLPYSYEAKFSPVDGNRPNYTFDGADRLQNITYTVGIGLGGTYKFADNWGLIIRGRIAYMLNPFIEETGYPRETTYNYGLNLGLKYSF